MKGIPINNAPSDGGNNTPEKVVKKRTLFHKIINVFLYFLLSILFILIIAFGFSQTSTFREILRENLISILNDEMNGTIYIERIDGTIFTSLHLKNTVVNMEEDTLFNIGEIELKTSPLNLFLNQIHIRKFQIKNAEIKFLADSSGELNISKLFPPSETVDTTEAGDFPFDIILKEFKLINISFSLQDEKLKNSDSYYDVMNFSDLRITDLYMNLQADARLRNGKNNFDLLLKEFSFNSNINNFNLKEITAGISISETGLLLNNFNFITDRSFITIFAEIKNIHLLNDDLETKLKDAPVKINLKSEPFSFKDLEVLIPEMKLLQGEANLYLSADGSISDFNINNINVDFLKTNLFLKGKIENLIDADNMKIDVAFTNSQLHQPDINSLLPSLELPVYENLPDVEIDTLTYKGSVNNFISNIKLRIGESDISSVTNLDISKEDLEYDIKLKTQHLNLKPITGMFTSLNIDADIEGKGTSPNKIDAIIDINAAGSLLEGMVFDTLYFLAAGKNNVIRFDFNSAVDSFSTFFGGSINFENQDKPSYDLMFFANNLQLEKFTNDTAMYSMLNFDFTLKGESFNPDSLNTVLELNINNVVFNNETLSKQKLILTAKPNEKNGREIKLESKFADLTFSGNFSIMDITEVLNEEIELIDYSFKEKINTYLPSDDTTFVLTKQEKIVSAIEKKVRNNFNIDYKLIFKDLEILSTFLKESDMEIDGSIQGEIVNNDNNFLFTIETNLDYLKFINNEETYLLSGLRIDFELRNPLDETEFNSYYSSFQIVSDKIFAGTTITNTLFDLKLKNGSLRYYFAADIEEDMTVDLAGSFDLLGDILKFDIDKLNFSFKDYKIRNREPMLFGYLNDKLEIREFVLYQNDGKISIDGIIDRFGKQELNINIEKLQMSEISKSILGMVSPAILSAEINIDGKLEGSFDAPFLQLDLKMNDFTYGPRNFGNIVSNVEYVNQLLNFDLKFIENSEKRNNKLLHLNGYFPFNMNFITDEERVIRDKQLLINLESENFDLAVIGNMLPFIDNLSGILNTNVNISGTLNEIQQKGNIQLKNGSFLAEQNNLEYSADANITFKNNLIQLDYFTVKNRGNVIRNGQLNANGKIELNGFEIEFMQFIINGDLLVLANESRSVSPAVYGTLFVGTEGDVAFVSSKGNNYLSAPIVVKEAKLIFPPTQSSYRNTLDDFIYRYKIDTTKVQNGREAEFEDLMRQAITRSKQREETSTASNFDYNINIKIRDDVGIEFILSPEANSKLIAELRGDLRYEMLKGRQNIQGELILMEGSKLEFIKTFSAAGKIYFESDLTNPNLDIVATYRNNIIDNSGKDVPVAVKIKLKGTLDELGKNFVENEENIAVYTGEDNINNNVSDPTRDKSDAVWFIITGKFSDTASEKDKALFADQAASLAGSMLGGVLNSVFGDYIRSVEVRTVGANTQVNLSGRYKRLSYSFGGSTDLFQDFSTANVRFEYGVFENFLIRLERKDATTTSSSSTNIQKVNELGFRYRFEF